MRATETMKTFGLILLVLGLALTVGPAEAQDACKTTFDIVGKSDNMWHQGSATNPTLTACPSQEITINAQAESGVHNIHVTGVAGAPAASQAIDEGSSAAYKFTAPASGSANYVCEFHSGTMKGTITFASTASAPTSGDGDGDKKTPGVQVLGVSIALLGAALILGRKQK